MASAASALKTRVIAGCWASAGGLAATAMYRRIRSFEEGAPCMRDAVAQLAACDAARGVLGGGELSIARWPRQVSVDKYRGRARASFELRGDAGSVHVLLGAQRQGAAQEALQARLEDEEDEAPEGGVSRYLRRPWELKLRLQQSLRELRGAGEQEVAEEETPWELDTLLFLPGGDGSRPHVLLGDPRSLPEYEVLCQRRDGDAKDEASRRRLRVVVGVAAVATVVAGGLRIVKSLRVSQSYGFVKQALLAHRDVAGALGPGARVQTSSGTFSASYINARVRLVGGGGAVADVDVAATRMKGGGGRWRVAMARMNHGGRILNLDKSLF